MSNSRYKTRKTIRLNKEAYMGGNTFHVTVRCYQKMDLLRNDVAKMTLEVLNNICENGQFKVFAAIAMPNHIHFLCSTNEGDVLTRHINRFKAVTTTIFHRQGYHGPLWQRRYYDHGLRSIESLQQIVLYILENPVRKGFVDDWKQWPYCVVSEGVGI